VTCGSKVRRSLLYIFLIDTDLAQVSGKNITENITQFVAVAAAKSLILAPRPGLEPGTCRLTVRRFRCQNKNRNQVLICFSLGSVFGHLTVVNAPGQSDVPT
jgi:hypothetical protein